MGNNRDLLPGLPNDVPSPLEVVDAVLDTVGEVALLPTRLVGGVAQSIADTAKGVEREIRKPIDEAEIPASPGKIIEGAIGVVTEGVSGAVNTVGQALDSVKRTADGVRGQVDALTR